MLTIQDLAMLERIKNLQVGDVIEDHLMGALPEKVKWLCIEHTKLGEGIMFITVAGSFCDIPFYMVEIRCEGKGNTIKIVSQGGRK